ncbi:MAG: hypothetical protein AABX79_03310 [Nanoarchaeota archaeon]
MKKKRTSAKHGRSRGLVFLCLFLVLSIFILSLAAAQNNDTEQEKVNLAYQCLKDKVSGKCSTLSSEEKVFSALATGDCKSDLTSDAKFKTDVKYTAQAVLALKGNSDGEKWLISRNVTPTELVWFLEIESPNQTSCSIKYSGQSYNVDIAADKKISSNAGSCLVLAQGDYWLRVSPSCYGTEFSISCNQNFLTTLLFKKSTSSTIHVLDKTNSAAPGGTTKEKVESYCFTQGASGASCNYEASAWAALAFDSLNKDVSSYLPYLITLAEDNQRFLPDSFLYALTANTEFEISLLSKQKNNQWWMESGDKFYDTALALYPLKSESPQEKTNSKNWLLTVQDTNGCWGNNIRNTAFILAALWPRLTGTGGTGDLPDCENSGYYCTTNAECSSSQGETLAEFDCPSLYKCCTTPALVQTCSEIGGNICSSNEECIGGTDLDSSDLRTGETCCIDGSCSVRNQEISDCELNSGTCRIGQCSGDEQESSYSCTIGSDVCCIQKKGTGIWRTWWIWALLILIILVVLGIIFRDRLRMSWHRMKSGSSKPGQRPMPPHYPPFFPGYQRPMTRPPERRILPFQQQPLRRPLARIKSGAQKELDDVLRKLKDMSK